MKCSIQKDIYEIRKVEEDALVRADAQNLPLKKYSGREEKSRTAKCILREQIARYGKPDEYLETWYKYIKGEVV